METLPTEVILDIAGKCRLEIMSTKTSYSQLIGGANTSAVSALVRQLKTGEISKQQLFDQLSKLHSESSTLADPDHAARTEIHSHSPVAPPFSPPKSRNSPIPVVATSSPSPSRHVEDVDVDREKEIERIIAEKRLQEGKHKRVELQDFIESGSEALKQSYDRCVHFDGFKSAFGNVLLMASLIYV